VNVASLLQDRGPGAEQEFDELAAVVAEMAGLIEGIAPGPGTQRAAQAGAGIELSGRVDDRVGFQNSATGLDLGF
jgi:hypothetical protein